MKRISFEVKLKVLSVHSGLVFFNWLISKLGDDSTSLIKNQKTQILLDMPHSSVFVCVIDNSCYVSVKILTSINYNEFTYSLDY